MGEVFKELTGDGLVHRVEQDGLFVEQDVGVVRHAARKGVHALKQGQTAVGRATQYRSSVIFTVQCILVSSFLSTIPPVSAEEFEQFFLRRYATFTAAA